MPNIESSPTPAILTLRPYKSYTCLLSVTGTNNPTSLVMENTLNGDIVWTRYGVGGYVGTLVGAFPVDKCWCATFVDGVQVYRSDDDTIAISTYVPFTFTPSDDILSISPVEIRVYS